jgi:hypothetical protein
MRWWGVRLGGRVEQRLWEREVEVSKPSKKAESCQKAEKKPKRPLLQKNLLWP